MSGHSFGGGGRSVASRPRCVSRQKAQSGTEWVQVIKPQGPSRAAHSFQVAPTPLTVPPAGQQASPPHAIHHLLSLWGASSALAGPDCHVCFQVTCTGASSLLQERVLSCVTSGLAAVFSLSSLKIQLCLCKHGLLDSAVSEEKATPFFCTRSACFWFPPTD